MVLATKSLASILGAGCTVVFKASELSPRTHHLLLELYMEAGIPPGVINVIQCRREDSPGVTEALISHKAIRKVEFIGSAAVGRIIASLSGKYLKPILLELGGKCPSIVLDDLNEAQLDEAAAKTIRYGQLYYPSMSLKRVWYLINCVYSIYEPRPSLLRVRAYYNTKKSCR